MTVSSEKVISPTVDLTLSISEVSAMWLGCKTCAGVDNILPTTAPVCLHQNRRAVSLLPHKDSTMGDLVREAVRLSIIRVDWISLQLACQPP